MLKEVILTIVACTCILIAGCTATDRLLDHTEVPGLMPEESAKMMSAPASEQYLPPSDIMREGGSKNADSIADISTEPKIIRTANLQLEVTDVRNITTEIQSIAESALGTVQSSSVSAGYNNQYSGTITIRIPSEKFEMVVQEIESLGKVLSSSTSADDVTEEYVDLAAQKNAQTNQLAQYNRILVQAVNVSEILEVQREIERVQVDLDRIVGRMKYLDSRVSLSTISIRLTEPARVTTSTGYSIATVISEGIEGFISTLVWLVVACMTFLPLILVGGAGYLIYKRWKKTS